MRLPTYRRIREEDFKDDQKDLIADLAVPINAGIETMYSALSNRLTPWDNFQCVYKTLEVVVNSSGLPLSPTTFQVNVDGASKIIGITVLKAENLSSTSVFPNAQPFITWDQSIQSVVNVKHVAGLPANNKFLLTFIAYY
jgi:hypothetical protein